LKVTGNLILDHVSTSAQAPLLICTHRTQSYGRCGEANKSTITSVGLMDSIGIIVTKLLNYLPDFLVLFVGNGFADKPFKSATINDVSSTYKDYILESTLLAFVVELVR